MRQTRWIVHLSLLLGLSLSPCHLSAGVGAWTPIGPPGASVTAIVVDPRTGTVYLGTRAGGVFASSDAGETWGHLYTPPTDVEVSALAIAGQTLYAGMQNPRSVAAAGVIRTRDGGQTWIDAGLVKQSVLSLAADPTSPATIYAITADALNRSTDEGATWQDIFHSDSTRHIRSVAVDPTNSTIVIAGTDVAGYKSIDGGATFLPLNRPPGCLGTFRPSFCDKVTNLPTGASGPFVFDPRSPGTVYAVTSQGTWRSRDRGANWEPFGPWFPFLVIDAARPGRLYGGSTGGVSSGAETGWIPAGEATGELTWGISALASDPTTPSRVYVGTYGLPLRSDDGGKSWAAPTQTLKELPVSAFAFDPSDPLTAWAAQAYGRGISRTTDGGVHWERTGFAETSTIDMIGVSPFDPAILVAFRSDPYDAYPRKRSLLSTDRGKTWLSGGELFNYPVPQFTGARVLLADPSSPGSWYLGYIAKGGGASYIATTRDNGLTWESIPIRSSVVYALAADPRAPGVAYAAAFGGVFRTADQGRTWELFNGNSGSFTSIEVDRKDSSLYLANAGGLLNTARGLLWHPTAEVPSDLLSVSEDPSSSPLYITTRSNVYRSYDSGSKWESIALGLPPSLTAGVSVHPKDGRLAISTAVGLLGREACGNATTLCLDNRYLVKARWTTADGQSGDGQPVSLSGQSGYFWFFSPNNVEVIAKIVDGCAVNSRVWAFAAGLTNVRVVLTVTDSRTGDVRTYENPQGTAFRPIQDTSAFAGCSADTPQSTEDRGALPTNPASAASMGTICLADATTLCVNGGRFQVRAGWTAADGKRGDGQAVALTGDTGYFWFFSSGSAELIVKVVSGCGWNSRFWTFAGGLTDVEVVLTVTDTKTGDVRSYVNAQGQAFAPIQDAAAFATCP